MASANDGREAAGLEWVCLESASGFVRPAEWEWAWVAGMEAGREEGSASTAAVRADIVDVSREGHATGSTRSFLPTTSRFLPAEPRPIGSTGTTIGRLRLRSE